MGPTGRGGTGGGGRLGGGGRKAGWRKADEESREIELTVTKLSPRSGIG